MRVVWTAVRLRLGPLLLTFKYQFYGIIAVIVLLICVCVSRIGSLDPTRERHTQISKTITAIINNPIKLIFKR